MGSKIAILAACAVVCSGCASEGAKVAGDLMPAASLVAAPEVPITRTNEDIIIRSDQIVRLHGVFDVKDGKLRAWDPDGQPSPTLYTDLTASRPKMSLEARSKYMPDDGEAGPYAVIEGPSLMVEGYDRREWNLSEPIRWAIETGCELPYLSVNVLPMTTDYESQTGAAQFNYGAPEETAKASMRAKMGESLSLCDVYALIDKVEVLGDKTTYSLSIQGLDVGKTLDLKVESIAADGKSTKAILAENHWVGTPTTADPFRITVTYPTSAKVLTFSLQANRYLHTTRFGIPTKPTSDVMKLYVPELAKKPVALNALPRTDKDLVLDPRKSISVVGLYDVAKGVIRVWGTDGKLNTELKDQLEDARSHLHPEAKAKYMPDHGDAGPFVAVYGTKGVILQSELAKYRALCVPITKVFADTRKSFTCSVQILPLIQDTASKSGAVRIDYSYLQGEGSIRDRKDYAEMLADPNRKPDVVKRNHPLTPVSAVLRVGLPVKPD